jgi:hypothetical protein
MCAIHLISGLLALMENSGSTANPVSEEYDVQHDRSLVGHILEHIPDTSFTGCIARCQDESACVGVNLLPDTSGRNCYLMDEINYMVDTTSASFMAGV